MYKLSANQGKAYKLAQLFHGPYRVLHVTKSNVSVTSVNKLNATPIFMARDRVCHCPKEIPEDVSWPPLKRNHQTGGEPESEEFPTVLEEFVPHEGSPSQDELAPQEESTSRQELQSLKDPVPERV